MQREAQRESQTSVAVVRDQQFEARQGSGGDKSSAAAGATADGNPAEEPSKGRAVDKPMVADRVTAKSSIAAGFQLGADESSRERLRRKCRLLHMFTAAESRESVKTFKKSFFLMFSIILFLHLHLLLFFLNLSSIRRERK